METIKYHQNGTGNEYGADHTLTNNWNPGDDYDNEYVNVHFRIEAKNFGYPSFSFSEEDRNNFYNEVYAALELLGWNIKSGYNNGSCMEVSKGMQHLYLHPQDFSGEVLKNEVKQIAEALQKHNTFYLRWVDLYETVYDVSDTEYDKYLNTKNTEIRKALFESCGTSRTNKFYYVLDICVNLSDRFGLKRIGINENGNYGKGQTMRHIGKIIDEMITEGLLIGAENNGSKLVRSLNKTELKKHKSKIA